MILNRSIIDAFSRKRNPSLNFPYLKENCELVAIASVLGLYAQKEWLDVYKPLYARALTFHQLYPQYYRFSLSLIHHLEEVGLNQEIGSKLSKIVSQQGCIQFETSDISRLEGLFYLEKYHKLTPEEASIKARGLRSMENYIDQSSLYMHLNLPHFYDLTHLIFYLTDYGRQPYPLNVDPRSSLLYAGSLAYLDEDVDLLAEFSICLRYLGAKVPKVWDDYIRLRAQKITIQFDNSVHSALNPKSDDYHVYLVCNWAMGVAGASVLKENLDQGVPFFIDARPKETILAKWSALNHNNIFGSTRFISEDEFLSTLSVDQIKHINVAKSAYPEMANILDHIFTTGQVVMAA